jgi:hypothetical protein
MTGIPVVVTRDASLLLHEWAHATVAWCFGLVRGPFDVTYHDWYLFSVSDKGDSLSPLGCCSSLSAAPS